MTGHSAREWEQRAHAAEARLAEAERQRAVLQQERDALAETVNYTEARLGVTEQALREATEEWRAWMTDPEITVPTKDDWAALERCEAALSEMGGTVPVPAVPPKVGTNWAANREA